MIDLNPDSDGFGTKIRVTVGCTFGRGAGIEYLKNLNICTLRNECSLLLPFFSGMLPHFFLFILSFSYITWLITNGYIVYGDAVIR
jgi:hypothetical protein